MILLLGFDQVKNAVQKSRLRALKMNPKMVIYRCTKMVQNHARF
jgi:hypothetical protein